MAGNVTGNLGSENITLRNIATEDTLSAILDVMREQKSSDGDEFKIREKNKKGVKENTDEIKRNSVAWGKFFDRLSDGPMKVLRNLDSEINNASYTFSTLSRDNSAFGKTLQFAATSVAQMQEQFNAYSKLMQVGGVMAGDFESLRNNAAGLGTDLTGLTRITEQYSNSLKIGSSTTALGLKKLKSTFEAVTNDTEMLRDFGRLGVLPQQISEQLLLAAEAQGGFGQVMKKYGNDATKFGQGMLKSTQELNVFATAIGANSQLMQQEAAKAAKRTSDQLFLKTLKPGEQMQYQYLQALTGNAELALEVMRSVKTGITTEQAGLFQASQGVSGMGQQIDNFMNMVAKGSKPLEALTNSGLLQFAKSLSEEQLQQLVNDEFAQRKFGNAQLADLMNNQLTMIRALRDSSPEEIEAQVEQLKSSLDPNKTGTTDTFVNLQDQQVRLAKSTAGLNTQFNRLGLLLAGSAMTGVNRGIHELGKGVEGMKRYAKEMFGVDVPDEVLKQGVDAVAVHITDFLEKVKVPTGAQQNTGANNLPTGRLATGGITPAGQINVKMPNGEGRLFNLTDILNNKALQAQTEALKGQNTQVGTLITGALLQQKVKNLSTITAGSDLSPAHSGSGKHPKGLALDFRVNEVKGRDPNEVYKETKAAIEEVLERDLGLKKGDYLVQDERTKGTAPHMHFQFTNQQAADKVRDYYQSQLKAVQDTPKNEKVSSNTAVDNRPPTSVAENSQQPTVGTVNNMPTVSIAKPDWWDESMRKSQEETRQLASTMGAKFDYMYDMLKMRLG